jgi:DNA (cytosine-5)-methyltransferase 1
MARQAARSKSKALSRGPAADARLGVRRPTAVDLFAGCGGLSSGLVAAGFDVVAAVEIDVDAASSYRANHTTTNLIQRDIRRITRADLLEGLPSGTCIDLVAGCPPCQGFTRLTENSGRSDPRNELVKHYLRLVRSLKPRTCMLENVPGLTRRGRVLYQELVAGLKKLGYVVDDKVVELADYGVPQFRKRLVLLATKKKQRPLRVPAATHHAPDSGQLPTWTTVADVIKGLPKPPQRSALRAAKKAKRRSPKAKRETAVSPWHYARDVAPIVKERLEWIRRHGRTRASLPARLALECHKKRAKLGTNQGYMDIYGVMRWDEPSPTITSGCTNASKGCFGHPRSPRPITAYEAALLQTFPENYVFKGSGLESVARQIGNALPSLFAQCVGAVIVEHLAE